MVLKKQSLIHVLDALRGLFFSVKKMIRAGAREQNLQCSAARVFSVGNRDDNEGFPVYKELNTRYPYYSSASPSSSVRSKQRVNVRISPRNLFMVKRWSAPFSLVRQKTPLPSASKKEK